MSDMEWKFLSYELSPELSNYGDGNRINIDRVRRMDRGDASNNSLLSLPAHTGTHIDFPFHFYQEGRTGSAYSAQELVFTNVGILDISHINPQDHLIRNEHLDLEALDKDIDFIIVYTGFCQYRNEEKYWKYNWGWAPETAGFLRQNFSRLRAFGFDLISLSAYQQREAGRAAHKEFLEKNDILIIEDMKLSGVNAKCEIDTMVVSPLRFSGSDGAPVTVFALMNNYAG